MGIVGSQIEIEKIFSFAGSFTDLMKCCLQTKNLKKLIFMKKSWPNDSRIGCKSSSHLLEFLEMDINLEEELEEFEEEFVKR